MKKQLIVILLMANFLNAQPVITSAVIPSIGQTISNSSISDTIYEWQLTTGANQVWNFNSLNISSANNLQFVSPSGTPYGVNYPSSNLCIENILPFDTLFTYQNIQAPFLEGLGSVSSGNTINYIDAIRTFGFPFTYGDSYSDYFEYFSSGSLQVHRTGILIVNAPAYGSLTTPAGTFPNCLMIKRNYDYTDTIYNGFPNIKFGYVTGYAFYQPSDYALLTVLYDSVYYPATGQSIVGYSANYRNFTTGVNELTNKDFFTVYPNPSMGDLKIKFENLITKGEIVLFNNLGIRVYEEQLLNQSEKAINIKSVSPGIYFAKVFDGEKYYCKKIIIEYN